APARRAREEAPSNERADGKADPDGDERRLLAARARRLRIRTDAFRRNAAAGLRPRVHEAAVPVQADLVRCGEAAQPRRAGERAGAADSRRREAGAAARDAEGDPGGPAGRL